MKSRDLPLRWAHRDDARLTARQQSFRLPVRIAAKLNALCEMYPHRTKTEIVGDLLGAALEEVYAGLPGEPGREVGHDAEHGTGPLYEELGPRAQFRTLANKHYKELEKELGNKNPGDLFSGEFVVSEQDLKQQ